jgi:hypothetical protein
MPQFSNSISSLVWSLSQCQSYFTTGGLPPISSSWRQTPSDSRPDFFFQLNACSYKSLCNILSDESMGLSFTIAAGPRQRIHSQVRFPQDSQPHYTVTDSRLPQPGGPDLCIYMLQEQGSLAISPGTGLPFRHLLWLGAILVVFDPASTPWRASLLFSLDVSWQRILTQ